MHSQELLTQIKNSLFSEPQKCIKLLSNKAFLNNLFHSQLEQLTAMLQSSLQKMNKDNKNISFVNVNQESTKSQQLNAQLIVCIYSIVIMKSTAKSIIASEEQASFNTKLAIQTLTKIYRQSKQQDVRKIVAALLLKVPSFSNHKNIVKDLDPHFISVKTMQKASSSFRTQCPNLYEDKLNTYKNTDWSRFLVYKPFKLDNYAQLIKKLQTVGLNTFDANALIQIKQQLSQQFEYLMKRIKLVQKEQFFIYEFCQKFSEIYRLKLEFPKLISNQKFTNDLKNSSKVLPNYNLNQLRLKILLEARNNLLVILNVLITKLSTYWTRKIKWLWDFIIERVQIFGIQEMGLTAIQQPEIYIQKLRQLKLTIRLCHTYYRQFGNGLFPEQRLKEVLFTQQFSFYKMIQAILYNEYEFVWQSQNSRIVNYQKNKKINEEVKNKQSLIKMVNVNSKSLNVNPHYDLVFQKVIHQITYKEGSAYSYLRQLILEALRFMKTYYKKSQTYFYGGNLISLIENCKNIEIPKQKIYQVLKEIKNVIYPSKRMIRQSLQFFCEELFQNQISKRRQLEEEKLRKIQQKIQVNNTLNLNGNSQKNQDKNDSQLTHQMRIQPSPKQDTKGTIRKTKSYDMVIQGWGNENTNHQTQKYSNAIPIRNQTNQGAQQSQIFYSIKQCSAKDENDTQKNVIQDESNMNSRFKSIKQDQSEANDQNFILTPDF